MFQLEGNINLHSSISEMAEYMELMCLMNNENHLSIEEAANAIYPEDDENSSPNESMRSKLGEALAKVDEREKYLKQRYPFYANNDFIEFKKEADQNFCEIYKFLVLATNENMGKNRISNGLDGTALFEKLSSFVLKNFFGENCKSFVFGTGDSEHSRFEDKINNLLQQIAEPDTFFRNPDGDNHKEKDGGIDVVANIPFGDRRKGQFLAFGQCKTGNSWLQSYGKLNSKIFCDSYLSPPLCFTPVNVYFLSESIYDNWEIRFRGSNGILFDRKRIIKKLPKDIDKKLLSDIHLWNEGIITRQRNDDCIK